MLSRSDRLKRRDSRVLPAPSAPAGPWTARDTAAALLVGGLLGVAVVLAGPVPVLVGLLGLIVALSAFRFPEVLVLLVLALASQLVPSRFNFFVDLAVARFQLSDLLLLWLLFVTVLRTAMEKRFPFRSTPLDLPLALFYGAVLLGLATAAVGFGVNFNNATYEARTLAYYLVFFPITNLVRTRAQLLRLAVGTIAVGMLLATSMLLQSAIQPALLADDWTIEGPGIVRNFHPGFSAVYVGVLMVAGYMAMRRPGTRGRFYNWRWLQWPRCGHWPAAPRRNTCMNMCRPR